MRGQRLIVAGAAFALAGTIAFAQVGRGGSQWLTSLADAQRTSWIRADDKISVAAMAKPGFELQWKVKLDNQPRGVQGLSQGVTASGVTLFVPMSIVTGSSNNVYGIDNDLGFVVWQRHFDAPLAAATAGCPGGITAAGTRIVSLTPTATPAGRGGFGGARGAGYRTLLGEPGEGVPVEGRVGGRGRAGEAAGSPPSPGSPGSAAAAAGQRGPGAPASPPAPAPAPPAGRGAQAERIPGTPSPQEGVQGGFLGRPSGVSYVVSSDGMLHVLGLPSGKDMQRPAQFVPANSRWSAPIAVGTTMYTGTSGNCGGAPNGVWAIDLDSDAKPVVSWKTNGGGVVGAIAFTSDGTLVASIGPGQTTGDGKANAIVALDPKTLELKDWFTQPTAEFVTGPTIVRHSDREIVAAATRDGRVLLLDARSLGGSDHSTALHSSKPFIGSGASVSADALAAWQQSSGAPAPAQTATPAAAAPPAAAPSTAGAPPAAAQAGAGPSTTWILLPVAGRVSAGTSAANGPVSSGAVVALKLVEEGGAISLAPGWVSHDLSVPATPLVVNGVVFTLATGRPASAASRGTPAVLHAYDGATGKRLWTSGKAMSAFASPGSFWSSLGQIYIGTHDGTLYAFGFNDERSPAGGG